MNKLSQLLDAFRGGLRQTKGLPLKALWAESRGTTL